VGEVAAVIAPRLDHCLEAMVTTRVFGRGRRSCAGGRRAHCRFKHPEFLTDVYRRHQIYRTMWSDITMPLLLVRIPPMAALISSTINWVKLMSQVQDRPKFHNVVDDLLQIC
jgi:hypothetical protein